MKYVLALLVNLRDRARREARERGSELKGVEGGNGPRKILALRKEENVEMESTRRPTKVSFALATLRRVQREGNCHGVRLHEDLARARPHAMEKFGSGTCIFSD